MGASFSTAPVHTRLEVRWASNQSFRSRSFTSGPNFAGETPFAKWPAIAALTIGCVRSPEAKKRQYLEMGDSYVAQKKYPEAIVAYRKEHGAFKSLDQLASVKGIGLKTVEKNREAITLGSAAK